MRPFYSYICDTTFTKRTTMNTKRAAIGALLCIPLFLYCQTDDTQSSPFLRNWSINLNAGPNLFYGDIEVYDFFPVMKNNNEWRTAYGLMVQKRLSSWFTLRGQMLNGKLSGTKRQYGKWFEADIFETSINATLDVSDLLWGQRDRTISIYIMGGVGLAQWRTELKEMNTNKVIRGNGLSEGGGIGGRTIEGVLPFGLGLDLSLSKRWNINVEGTLRPVNSDLLDANKGDFPFDFYSYNFVGVSYNFGVEEPPKPIEPEPVEGLVADVEEVPEPVDIPPVESDELLDEELRELEEEIMETESGTGIGESPWPGIEFRVQILASREEADPGKLKNKFGLDEEIHVNKGDGWYRYSVGSFEWYRKAREYRNVLISRNHVYDAFVVGYRGDERIALNKLTGVSELEDISGAEIPQTGIPEFEYRVQILASKDENFDLDGFRTRYKINEPVKKEKDGNWYKFTSGSFNDYKEAMKYRDQLIRRGIRDAFVTAYINDERVPLSKVIGLD